ncbi:MAG TPA: M42 family peptidase [Candidatus Coatesbacteria bacterium]|nr:M42 family peptidase [Candidatus Coatesbacteria bacterium]
MEKVIGPLCQLYGPSGHEERVVETVGKMVKPHVDELRRDVMGNLITRVGQGGKKLLFAAHTDEIGVVVHYIDEDGFARVSPVGGVQPLWLYGRRVRFANGAVGVIGREQRGTTPKDTDWGNLFLDVGVTSQKDARKLIAVGDFGVFDHSTEFQGKVVVSKALDDRIGCAVLVEALKKLGKKAKNEVYFVFTVQEEVGVRGARTSAWSVTPDVGYAVDVTGWGDTPLVEPMNTRLGHGAAIKAMDQGIVVSPRVRKLMVDTAEKRGIPYQMEVLRGGATDAFGIQFTKTGVPCGVISIPTRYIHQPSEMAHLDDFAAAVELVCALANADHAGI